MSNELDRRRWRRYRRFEEHGIVSVRLRGERVVWLVDVSAGGLVFESPVRVVPGALVHVQVTTRDRTVSATGRLVHCTISRVEPDGVWYRGGAAFVDTIEWRPPDRDGEHALPTNERTDRAAGPGYPGVAANPRGSR